MVDNWNLPVPFGSGAVSVDPIHRRLCYQLDARQPLVFASALPVLLMVVAVTNGGTAEMLLVALVIWLWLVGGNLLIGIPRFRRFLRKTLTSKSNRLTRERDAPPATLRGPERAPQNSANPFIEVFCVGGLDSHG